MARRQIFLRSLIILTSCPAKNNVINHLAAPTVRDHFSRRLVYLIASKILYVKDAFVDPQPGELCPSCIPFLSIIVDFIRGNIRLFINQ